MKALGLIETRGMVGAIVAADIALKTAQVELINREHTKGGHVIPRPDDSVEKIIKRKLGTSEQKEEVVEETKEEVKEEPKETEVEEEVSENSEMKKIEEEIEEINEILKVSKNKKTKHKK